MFKFEQVNRKQYHHLRCQIKLHYKKFDLGKPNITCGQGNILERHEVIASMGKVDICPSDACYSCSSSTMIFTEKCFFTEKEYNDLLINVCIFI